MKTLSTIVLASALAGCSGQSTEPVSPVSPDAPQDAKGGQGTKGPRQATAPAQQITDVAENLGRLRALQVFEVQGIIENIPEQANCYNIACPGQEKAFSDAKAAAAAKLATFTDAVVRAAALPVATQNANDVATAANLEALRALKVVNIGELIVEHPAASPNCYNLVCPADEEAAAEKNRERAAKLANIAHALAR